jgi:hypothetical protein
MIRAISRRRRYEGGGGVSNNNAAHVEENMSGVSVGNRYAYLVAGAGVVICGMLVLAGVSVCVMMDSPMKTTSAPASTIAPTNKGRYPEELRGSKRLPVVRLLSESFKAILTS